MKLRRNICDFVNFSYMFWFFVFMFVDINKYVLVYGSVDYKYDNLF